MSKPTKVILKLDALIQRQGTVKTWHMLYDYCQSESVSIKDAYNVIYRFDMLLCPISNGSVKAVVNAYLKCLVSDATFYELEKGLL